jgi:hypothetical protein
MLWAVCAVVVIGAGLPLTAWLATRGLARRPSAPLKPYHGRAESWIHRQYQLGWPECSLIHDAVAQGCRVGDPGLEDAAHRLAAATLRRKVPGTRAVHLAARVNLVLGPAMVSLGIASFFLSENRFFAVYFIGEGALFGTLGWLNYARGPRKQRDNAARALDLNRPAGP